MSDTVETPTKAIVRASVPVEKTVTDARGRVLVFKPHDLLSKMRLFGIVGSEKAKNDIYMGYLLMVTSVQSIDGIPMPRPRNFEQVEQMVATVDDDGVNAMILSAIPADEPDPA